MQGKPAKNVKKKAPNGAIKEEEVSCSSTEVLQVLVGAQDQNLKVIEKKLEVKVGRGNTGLLVSGNDADVDLAVDLLVQLRELIEQGEPLFPGDVERALKLLSKDRKAKLADLFRESVQISGRKRHIVPKTFTQKLYIEAIKENDIVFGVGPAGTGKTYLAMAMAVSALMERQVKRVVLCRPAVEAGEKIGFLPGDMAEKVNPYLRPLYDALHDMVDYEKAKDMVDKGLVEVAPLAFMRGRTLADAFVVLDEAQNTSHGQMKMFLTRLGKKSKCVITGDVTQVDLPKDTKSGLVEVLRILKNVKGIATVNFSEEDVIRHKLVSDIVAAYKRDQEGREGS